MEQYLILARSVTYAQRMQRALQRSGIRCQISRAPREVTDLGCAYAVWVQSQDLPQAVVTIRRENLSPVQIFLSQQGFYREVNL